MTDEPQTEPDPRVGETIAQFRIVERIGEGAMGVVYRARDMRLDRVVALKVLRPWLADRAGWERLLREARSAAAVAHPGIAAVYEVGEAGGETFIAMEHVEGETLRARLSGGALPPGEVLRIGLDVAKALGRAHAAGVVHRDLNPENLMTTDDGVKILDYGLAKLLGASADVPAPPADRDGPGAGAEPFRSVEGQIVGTPGYMSPEQTRGEAVDARSDVFSLGAVLYELVTGERPFGGSTPLVTLVSTQRDEPPPPSRRSPRIWPELERIIMRCLAKDPARRYASADALVTHLRGAMERSTTLSSAPTLDLGRASRPSGRRPVRFVVLALALFAAIGSPLVVWRLVRTPVEPAHDSSEASSASGPLALPFEPARRITANPSDDLVRDASLSADGRRLAYLDESGLHVREVATGRTRSVPLPPAVVAQEVVWMPDGRGLVLEMEDPGVPSIWSVSVDTGEHRLVRRRARRPAVSPDGRRIAFLADDALWVMDADGERARPLVRERSPEVFLRATWSPGGTRIAYVAAHPYGTPDDLVTVPADGGSPVVALSDRRLTILTAGSASGLAWAPDGRILFVLDALAPELTGTTLLELAVDEQTGRRLGAPHQIAHWPGVAAYRLSMSADGRRLAMLQAELQSDVWLAELPADRTPLVDARRLTRDDRNDFPSAWTPDSRSILFTSDRSGAYGLWRQPIDGGPAVSIPSGAGWSTWAIPGPDGESLLHWSLALPGPDPVRRVIVRTPLAGGTPRTIAEAGTEGVPRPSLAPPNRAALRCSRSGRCVVGTVEGGWLAFAPLDPERGLGPEIVRLRIERDAAAWDLSPDGERIVVRSGATRVVSLADGTSETMDTPSGCDQPSFDTAGRGILFACNLGGRASIRLADGAVVRELWASEEVAVQILVPSPDGTRLAFTATPLDNDAWLLERP